MALCQRSVVRSMIRLVTDKMEEKPISGYPKYFATADGKIISYRRGDMQRILSDCFDNHGYKIVSLFDKHSRQYTRAVHQLILESHGFMKSIDRDQVRHKDGDKLNNRLENLEWSDGFENYRDRIKHGVDMVAIRKRLYWNTSSSAKGTGSKPREAA